MSLPLTFAGKLFEHYSDPAHLQHSLQRHPERTNSRIAFLIDILTSANLREEQLPQLSGESKNRFFVSLKQFSSSITWNGLLKKAIERREDEIAAQLTWCGAPFTRGEKEALAWQRGRLPFPKLSEVAISQVRVSEDEPTQAFARDFFTNEYRAVVREACDQGRVEQFFGKISPQNRTVFLQGLLQSQNPDSAKKIFALPREAIHQIFGDFQQPGLPLQTLQWLAKIGTREMREIFLDCYPDLVTEIIHSSRHETETERLEELLSRVRGKKLSLRAWAKLSNLLPRRRDLAKHVIASLTRQNIWELHGESLLNSDFRANLVKQGWMEEVRSLFKFLRDFGSFSGSLSFLERSWGFEEALKHPDGRIFRDFLSLLTEREQEQLAELMRSKFAGGEFGLKNVETFRRLQEITSQDGILDTDVLCAIRSQSMEFFENVWNEYLSQEENIEGISKGEFKKFLSAALSVPTLEVSERFQLILADSFLIKKPDGQLAPTYENSIKLFHIVCDVIKKDPYPEERFISLFTWCVSLLSDEQLAEAGLLHKSPFREYRGIVRLMMDRFADDVRHVNGIPIKVVTMCLQGSNFPEEIHTADSGAVDALLVYLHTRQFRVPKTGYLKVTHDNFKALAKAATEYSVPTAWLQEWLSGHPECAHWSKYLQDNPLSLKRKSSEELAEQRNPKRIRIEN